ncbi:NAD(P)/FAD-dependent oxidoreductase [Tahibacter harae]|uniref:NAD(P)/FAD-dependent oxidoreductase n=1 Tax=Tahibacter harae TaxID=2963937 RepID=A0ABT1QRT4_9GAMM|nr:NAD(P)/FAD-dependent oxidoreductase [Tahibacter harae]MCQ4164994.1 NAD(P)/FAD-dependent oxidoreductase [Tahibacter harae]
MTPYDALIVGGSYAGLAAGLILARARRRILIADAGAPRNHVARHAHGVLAQDGRPGHEILAAARAQLAAYPGVSWLAQEVTAACGSDGDFRLHAADGTAWRSRKLLLASGVTDTLPDIPGLAECWGASVLHCPYCHGYEIGGGAIGVLNATPHAALHAQLIADWGEVTLFTQGADVIDAEQRAQLTRRRIALETVPVRRAEGQGRQLSGLHLADGRRVPLRALFVAVQTNPRGALPGLLGCALESTPQGSILQTDAQKQTSIAGVYAAGDAALARSNITLAAADGVNAAVALHHALIATDDPARRLA